MWNYVLSWISYLLFALEWIWILKRFFCDTWSRAWKTRSESRETNNPPYVENNYRIEVKITFMLIAYLVLLCEFFWEFSIFHFCRPLVDIYWHPLLRWLSSWFLISKRNIQVHQKDTLNLSIHSSCLKALNDGGRLRLQQVLSREFKVKSPPPDFLHPPA